MEASPLLLAHSHARTATLEFQKSNATVASKEHELAAGEFAKAAEGTDDTEAHRILKLLEEHHQQLSRMIQSNTAAPTVALSDDVVPEETKPSAAELVPPDATAPSVPRAPSPEQKAKSPSEAILQQRASRGPHSSIASNLASARGIPSGQKRRPQPVSPTLSTNNAEGKIANDSGNQLSPVARRELVQRRLSGRVNLEKGSPSGDNGRVVSSNGQKVERDGSRETQTATSASQPGNDDSFQKFYSSLKDRIYSLPSYLAFAGLPLSPTSESSEMPTAQSISKAPTNGFTTNTRATVDASVNNLFSPAALRAVKEDQPTGFGGTESFYVVPTTGGTVSYAGILGREDSGQGLRFSTGSGGAEGEGSDEYVDALERPVPGSPRVVRTRDGLRQGGKTMEELLLENSNLRRGIDILSNRLAQWEVGSQAQSMALRQSVMAERAGVEHDETNTKVKGKANRDTNNSNNDSVSEEEKKRYEERIAKLELEKEKLTSVVVRYRERWEKLKEGARTRRETGGKVEGTRMQPQSIELL
ncbi:MAG: hypothetical protein M1820_001694 [Bogoriella megaspora]|nr:MAG: hypothetical protein M1820_001694 [Bogoriella megaspora]